MEGPSRELMCDGIGKTLSAHIAGYRALCLRFKAGVRDRCSAVVPQSSG